MAQKILERVKDFKSVTEILAIIDEPDAGMFKTALVDELLQDMTERGLLVWVIGSDKYKAAE